MGDPRLTWRFTEKEEDLQGEELKVYNKLPSRNEQGGYLLFRRESIKNGESWADPRRRTIARWNAMQHGRTTAGKDEKRYWITGFTRLEAFENEILRVLGRRFAQGRWKWLKYLYERYVTGEEGWFVVVSLYGREDDDGNLAERVVVKTESFQNEDHQKHYHAQEKKMVDELGRARCHHIFLPKICDVSRTYSFGTDWRHRTYSTYAQHQDLKKILEHYRTDYTDYPIPEPFIWHTFLALSEAIFAFNTNLCADVRFPNGFPADLQVLKTPLWHRDIKPDNVFLDSARVPYLAYPTPRLGDYGVSTRIPENEDDLAALKDKAYGTETWQPPEHYLEAKAPDWPISTKSDIWAVGLLIWEMMNTTRGNAPEMPEGYEIPFRNKAYAKQDWFEHNDPAWTDRIEARNRFSTMETDTFARREDFERKTPNASYTMRLFQFVWKCLKQNPSDRPEFWQLRHDLQKEIRRAEMMFGDFKTDAPRAHLALRLLPEEFKQGDRFPGGGGDDGDDGDDGKKGRKKGHKRRHSDELDEDDDDDDDDDDGVPPAPPAKKAKGKGKENNAPAEPPAKKPPPKDKGKGKGKQRDDDEAPQTPPAKKPPPEDKGKGKGKQRDHDEAPQAPPAPPVKKPAPRDKGKGKQRDDDEAPHTPPARPAPPVKKPAPKGKEKGKQHDDAEAPQTPPARPAPPAKKPLPAKKAPQAPPAPPAKKPPPKGKGKEKAEAIVISSDDDSDDDDSDDDSDDSGGPPAPPPAGKKGKAPAKALQTKSAAPKKRKKDADDDDEEEEIAGPAAKKKKTAKGEENEAPAQAPEKPKKKRLVRGRDLKKK